MSLRLKAGIAGCAFALVLSACSQSPDQSPPKRKPVLTGMFADHPVEGLGFSGSKLTNRQGEFQYRQGESVRFFIGKIVLGSAPGAHAVTPLQLYPGATTAEGAGTTSTASRQATNVARLLITLDADCDETDGIRITPAARTAATEALNFNQDEAAFAADPAVMSYLARAGAQCQMPTGATARAFLADTNRHMALHDGFANRLPTANAGSDSAPNEGSSVTLAGAGTDDDGSITGYRWTQIGGPQVIVGPQSTQNLTFTAPIVAANTALTFRLRVTDDDGATHDDDVLVTVLNSTPNQVPVADAGLSRTVNELTTGVALNGTGSHDFENGTDLVYAWTQKSGPTVTLAQAGTPAPTFTAPAVGAGGADLVFELTVTDRGQPAGQNIQSAKDQVTIHVANVTNPEGVPVVNAGADQTVDEVTGGLATLVQLEGTASDPDNQGLTVQWTQLEDGAPRVLLDGADTLTPSFHAPNVTGDQVLGFQLTATDGAGDSASSLVHVTVLDGRILSVIAPAATLEGAPGATHVLSFPVHLSAPVAAGHSVQVDYSTVPGTAREAATATDAGDYRRAVGTLTFGEGEQDKTVDVVIVGDDYVELAEQFALVLSNVRGAGDGGLAPSALGTITDDDTNTTLLRIGAATASIQPTPQEIAGVEEDRVGGAGTHKQFFNLGGFGVNPLQNLPDDPAGGVQEANGSLTEPASREVFVNGRGQREDTRVRLMVIEPPNAAPADGAKRIVFVMIDAIGAGNVIQKDMKDALIAAAAAEGVTLLPENILFGQTHSHTAADLQGLWGGVPQMWIQDHLYAPAKTALKAAIRTRRPSHLSFRQGYTVQFNNYRRPRIDPDADADGTITLLSAVADDGTPVGNILQYNAHPTSIGDGNKPRTAHSEYILGAMEWLEDTQTGPGGASLYFNGPIADASPSGSRPGCVNREANNTAGGAQAFGEVRCRGEGIAQFAQTTPSRPLAATIEAQTVEVTLPVTNAAFLAVGAAGTFNRYYNFEDVVTDQIPGLDPAMLVDLPQVTPVARTMVTRITLGGAEQGLEIVTIPGETTNTYAGYIRSLAKTNVMLLGLTQNSFGYILPEEEFSYVDQSGDDGFTAPFTGYEEYVSLGPLTATILRSQGYNVLFGIDPSTGKDIPPALSDCLVNPDSTACILQVLDFRIALAKAEFRACLEQGLLSDACPLHGALSNVSDGFQTIADGCRDFGGPEEFCSLFDAFGDAGHTGTGEQLDLDLAPLAAETELRGCDFIDPNYCLFPFPNDFFTRADATTDTGKRLNFNVAAMPRNVYGHPVDPTEWNRNDGFSPGQLVETRVAGLSLDASKYTADGLVIPSLTEMQKSLEPNSAVVVIDATEKLPGTSVPNPQYLKQHLVWAELDANVTKWGPCDVTRPAEVLAELTGQDDLLDFGHDLRAQCEAQAANPLYRNNPADDPGPALLIRAGVNYEEGHTYIVALRRLRNASGRLLPVSTGFHAYRDGVTTHIPTVEDRRSHFEEIFSKLASAGIPRSQLSLAWDFTIASERNLTERVLAIRDDAFARVLDGGVPQFSIDSVRDFDVTASNCEGSAQDGGDPGRGDANSGDCIARQITGTVTVPNYMDRTRPEAPANPVTDESPVPVAQYVGGRLYYDATSADPNAFAECLVNGGRDCAQQLAFGDGLPRQNPLEPTTTFEFTCNIPRSAFNGATHPSQAAVVRPARPSLYGHGLLGSHGEVNQSQLKRFANEHNFAFCATDWIGMSEQDIANVASILVDMSQFPTLADRAQQGFLNKMFLARLLKDPRGFAASEAFQLGGKALIDNSAVYYDGNSQGGIMGGALVALSPDIQRGSLGVLGMNYSTLLQRSTDFAGYSPFLYASYQKSLDQQFLLSLIQILWDRAENDGYAQHLGDGVAATVSDSTGRSHTLGIANQALPAVPASYAPGQSPFAGVARMPEKEVLLHPAFGDHQVTYWSAEAMARTVGANGADAYFRGPSAQGTAGGTVTHTYASKADFYAQRKPDAVDFFGLDTLDYSDTQQIAGSMLIEWDEGKTAVPPLNNTAPFADNFDPHEYIRRTVAARCQKARFLRADGRVVDVSGLKNDRSVPCPTEDGIGNPFEGDPLPVTPGSGGSTGDGAAAPDYGTGIIGAIARLTADLHDVITAMLQGDVGAFTAGLQDALATFGDSVASLLTSPPSDAESLGAFIGLSQSPDAAAQQAVGADRNAAPVVITGAQVPDWSAPAATGLPNAYPSGVGGDGDAVSQGADGALGTEFFVRDAHNGVLVYPAAGQAPVRTGVPVQNIAAYAFKGGAWVEIPVQVDERMPYFLANSNSGFSFYSGTDQELTYVWDTEAWGMTAGLCRREYPSSTVPTRDAKDHDTTGITAPTADPVPGLDHDDEIVFMASDAGEFSTDPTSHPADVDATRGAQQIAIADPLDPSAQRFVYLFQKTGGSSFKARRNDWYVKYQRDANADEWIDRSFFADGDPQKLGTSNTGYGPNLGGTVCKNGVPVYSDDRFPRDGVTVSTAKYQWKATGRWMVRELRVAKPNQPGSYGPDMVDRWKGRAFQQSPDSNISVVGFEDEQVNWEANSALLGERAGPVRAIREVWGADSGTNVTKTETFYRDAVAYRYHVRVHPIPPDGLYTSWDYNRGAMIPTASEAAAGVQGGRYFTTLRPQGVPIDGINDDIGNVDGFAPIPGAGPDGGPGCPSPDDSGFIAPNGFGRCPAFFDSADPSFNLLLSFNNWEQVSGKGSSGSLVYTFENKGTTSYGNPLVVPYYRDDACLDDGTGDDPVQRPYPGERSDDSRVIAGYRAANGGIAYDQIPCSGKQGAYASHGVHYFFTGDTDNAFSPVTTTEIDGQQWQFAVPTAQPTNVGELYANNVRVPLQAVAVPLPAGGAPSTDGRSGGLAGIITGFVEDMTLFIAGLADMDLVASLQSAATAVHNAIVAAQSALYAGGVSVTQVASGNGTLGGITDVVLGGANGDTVLAGVGVVDMTPDVGYCAGQYCDDGTDTATNLPGGEEDPFLTHKAKSHSYGVQSRLTARAIVVQGKAGPDGKGGKRIALLKTDNYLAQDLLLRRVAQILAKGNSGIGYEQILHAVTHNHSAAYSSTLAAGPMLFEDAYDARFFENQARRMAEAIEIAAANLKPARMGATVVNHSVYKGNVVRHATADDGTPAGYPLEYNDHQLTVLRFDDVSDPAHPKPIATWINWGQHGEGNDGMDLHSADFLAPLERFVERETGAPMVYSQGDVGSAENSGNASELIADDGTVCGHWFEGAAAPSDGRCAPGEGVVRDFDHKNYAANEQNVRFLADAVVKAWTDIGAGNALVPFSTSVPVDFVNGWVPGPLSHPYPSVSNCRSEPTVGGDTGVPVLGLPDCERTGFPGDNPVSEQALLIYETMKAEGVPVPDHYDAVGFEGVQENVRIKLQAFRLGDVLLASCACEAQNDLILNLKSRTDRATDNIYDGFDWACLMPGYRDDAGPGGAWAAACETQRRYYEPSQPLRSREGYASSVPGSHAFVRGNAADDALIAHMRAQLHNDARGWDAPENALTAGSEPVDASSIWGNFTREEIQDVGGQGFRLPVGVGHAGDYNGYTVSYREYMNRDSYRKALTTYGPHTADYMVTRLVRMAAQLQGGPDLVPEIHDAAAQADEARQEALATLVGQVTSAAYDAWHAALPNDIGPAAPVTQPASITRFGAATFTWRGGSTAADNPVATVEKLCTGADLLDLDHPLLMVSCQKAGVGNWGEFADAQGEVQTQVKFPDGLEGIVMTYAGQQEWLWRANFEAYSAFPARLGSTPAGDYRFRVRGAIRQHSETRGYSFASNSFRVKPYAALAVGPVTAGASQVSFTVPAIAYPRTPAGSSFRFIADNGSARLCDRCSFRPWAHTGQLASAQVIVTRTSDGAVLRSAAASCTAGAPATCAAPVALAPGESATVRITDQDGNYGEAHP